MKNAKRAYLNEEIHRLYEKNRPVHYTPWYSDRQGLLSGENFKAQLKGKLKNKLFLICGPFEMMRCLTEQLNQMGVKNRDIIVEDFNLMN